MCVCVCATLSLSLSLISVCMRVCMCVYVCLCACVCDQFVNRYRHGSHSECSCAAIQSEPSFATTAIVNLIRTNCISIINTTSTPILSSTKHPFSPNASRPPPTPVGSLGSLGAVLSVEPCTSWYGAATRPNHPPNRPIPRAQEDA